VLGGRLCWPSLSRRWMLLMVDWRAVAGYPRLESPARNPIGGRGEIAADDARERDLRAGADDDGSSPCPARTSFDTDVNSHPHPSTLAFLKSSTSHLP
jgi:hypothetical protein